MNFPSFSAFSNLSSQGALGRDNFGPGVQGRGLKESSDGAKSAEQSGRSGKAADQNSVAKSDAAASSTPVSTQSPEVTAANILRHVYQSVEGLRKEGASEARIAERLEAAKEGIEKGYREARSILEDLGRLDETLAADIDRGAALISEGLADIEAGNRPALLAAPESNNRPDSSAASAYSIAGTRTSSSLSLEVMTQDGDRVTVNFRQREGSLAVSTPGMSLSASAFSSQYEMQVKGSLDDAEIAALETLFDDVGKLSETFYGGDLGAALEEAMSLGFDGNELASMSLELRQRSFSNVSRAYGEAGPSLPTSRLESQQNMITEYVKAYTSALDRASPLSEPRDTLQKMMEALVPEDDRIGALRQFNEGIAQLLGR